MNISDPYAITNEFWQEFVSIMETAHDVRAAAMTLGSMMGTQYFLDIIQAFGTMQGLHTEISSTLEDIQGRQISFFRVATIDQLILSIKYYVIAWSTMIDVTASLVNIVFNLGIAAGDVNLRLVTGNKHVRGTEVFAILQS